MGEHCYTQHERTRNNTYLRALAGHGSLDGVRLHHKQHQLVLGESLPRGQSEGLGPKPEHRGAAKRAQRNKQRTRQRYAAFLRCSTTGSTSPCSVKGCPGGRAVKKRGDLGTTPLQHHETAKRAQPKQHLSASFISEVCTWCCMCSTSNSTSPCPCGGLQRDHRPNANNTKQYR